MAGVIDGIVRSGDEVRLELTNAVSEVANNVRTSFGPTGADKLLISATGDVNVTNDGATIVAQMDVQHPAAKVVVDLAKLQDDEVGDGTTTVVLLVAELLKKALSLIQMKIHPTIIISGFRQAGRESVKYISNNLSIETSTLPATTLLNVAQTSLSSKIVSIDLQHFSQMVVDAVKNVKNDDGKYPVKAISILKQHGKSLRESELLDGFAINIARAAQGMPTSVTDAKIALIDFDLRVTKLKLGVQILIDDPQQIKMIQKREVDMAKERIQKIIQAGANVIMTTKGIDDACMKYLIEAKVMGLRRCKKDDLKRLAKATGGSVLLCMSSADERSENEEVFEPSWLGRAAEVTEERIADDECIIVKGCSKLKQCSILLRGANTMVLDEAHRSVNDALQAVKRALESPQVVAGGGAVETALSVHLEKLAMSAGSRDQLAIGEYASALLQIPKQLASNAALDCMDLLAQLRVAHTTAQEKAPELKYTGLDLFNNKVTNMVAAGIIEPAMSKIKSIQMATEAAITILRVDQDIQLNPKKEIEHQGHPGH